jgi:hypothetical protein
MSEVPADSPPRRNKIVRCLIMMVVNVLLLMMRVLSVGEERQP